MSRFDIERLLKELGDGDQDVAAIESGSATTSAGDEDALRPPDFRTGNGLGTEIDPNQDPKQIRSDRP